MRCPKCHSTMASGFIPTGGGLSWFRRSDGPSTDFAQHVPGTFAILRRARLPAWRCVRCQLIIFEYGHDVQRRLAMKQVNEQADQPNDGEAPTT